MQVGDRRGKRNFENDSVSERQFHREQVQDGDLGEFFIVDTLSVVH